MPRGGSTPTVGQTVEYSRYIGPTEGYAGPFDLEVTAVNGTHVDGAVSGDPDAGLGDPYNVTSVPPVAEASSVSSFYQVDGLGG